MTSWARLGWLVRVTAVVVAVAFSWRVSLAYAMPCTHEVRTAEATESPGDGCCPPTAMSAGERKADPAGAPTVSDARDTEGGDCPCPIDCSPCCGGAVMHALPAGLLAPPSLLAVFVDLPDPRAPWHRQLGSDQEILHVPR